MLFAFIFPPSLTCQVPAMRTTQSMVSDAELSSQRRKDLIEHRFRSIHPAPLPQFDGAVPGAKLLEQRRMRSEALQNRIAASHAVAPRASSTSTALPGIEMRPTLPGGATPTAVVTGDFNGDGHQDFVIANGVTNDLWIYLGNGDGTFQLPQIVPLSQGLSPVYLATGDLRGNGKLDLVVAESDSMTVGVLLGNGDGTFGYEQVYSLPEPTAAVVVDDFNHDGKLDIAAVMDTSENIALPTTGIPYLALLIGDGTGNFAAPVITSNYGFFSSASNLVSGDVNGDGRPDLLITGTGIENSQIYLNNGDGTFKAGATIQQNSNFDFLMDGRLADLNGDGCLDAVVADANSEVWVALGDCSGNFSTPVAYGAGDTNAAVRVADVNGDGIPDLVLSSVPAIAPDGLITAGNTLNVLLGDGKGHFGVSRTYPGPGESFSIGVADFNGDGKPDFVTANSDDDSVTAYINDGTGSFGFPQGLYTATSSTGMALSNPGGPTFADLNGDGKPDVFFFSGGDVNGDFYAASYLNDGTGRLAPALASDSGIPAQYPGDYRLGNFRNTGHLDMVAIGQNSAYSNTADYILFMPGNGDGTFGKGTLVSPANANGLMGTGDFNGDGKLDFVSVNGNGSHTLTTFLGNGDGTFRAGATMAFTDVNGVVSRVFTSDFNRDGKLDVLVFTTDNGYDVTTSTVWEFDGNGDGTFETGKQLYTDFQPFAMGDVNGDGYLDIARYDTEWATGSSTTAAPARFTTYLDKADGTFSQSSSYAPYSGVPEALWPILQFGDPLASGLVADYNADGKPDELALERATGLSFYGQIMMGNGDGTFTPTYDEIPLYYWQYAIYAHDMNGDGYADIAEVDSNSSAIEIFNGGPAPTLQISLENPIVTGNADCGWVFPDVASASSQSVALSSSVSGVVLPSSVTIPANATSAKFCFTLASNYNWRQVFDVKAQLNGSTATAYGSDSYVQGFSESLSPTSLPPIYAGLSSAPITVSLTSSQGYSSTVKLSCVDLIEGDSCTFALDTLDVSPNGVAKTAVTLNTTHLTADNAGTHPFTILADDGNVAKRQTIPLTVSELVVDADGSASIESGSPGKGSNTLTVVGIPPYSLSCSGLPTGATCSFSGTQLPYGSDSSLTDTVTVSSGVASGSYPFNINVTSGGVNATAVETLQVVGFSLQGPSAGSTTAIVGTTQNIPITIQGSANASESGSVTINCSLDSGATCSGGNLPITAGAQTFDLSLAVAASASTGQHQLTVTATFEGNTQTLTFPVSIVSFGGTLSASSLSLARSASGTVTASLTASTGFADKVTLACSGSIEVSCSFSPPSTQLTGGTPQSVTVTMTAGETASLQLPPEPASGPRLISLAALFPLGLLWIARRRRWKNLLLLAISIPILLQVVSCGSGGNGVGSGGGGGGSNSYSIMITGSVSGTTATATLGTVDVVVTH